MSRIQGKFWCFTEQSQPEEFKENMGVIFNSGGIAYICGQLEIASTTGKLHFQGYVQLEISRALSWVKNNISATAHWEKQKGTNVQARKYCTPEKEEEKETLVQGSFVEFGTFIAGRAVAGARNDIHSFREAIIGGATQKELIENDAHLETFAKYIKMHDRIRTLYPTKRKREDDFKVILYVGEPGSGKTRKAHEDHPGLFEVPISNGTLWFDGYDGDEVVLFDDFLGAGSKMSLDNTLKFFDRYVRKIPVKGGHAWYSPTTIIVTSNYHPRSWYKWTDREESWKALCRRFHEVWSFRLDQEPVQEDAQEYLTDRELWPRSEDDYNPSG